MGDEDEHELVDNPQRAWLVAQRTKIDPAAESLKTSLDAGRDALTGGAWTGTKGAAWGQEFSGRLQQLKSKAQRVQDDLADEIARKPLQVCRCQLAARTTPFPLVLPTEGQVFGIGGYPTVSSVCSE